MLSLDEAGLFEQARQRGIPQVLRYHSGEWHLWDVEVGAGPRARPGPVPARRVVSEEALLEMCEVRRAV